MNFKATSILFALFAIVLPILIHLLNRRRHRTIKWAAMEFILKATRESRGKKKLKHIIILTARTLALAGLIFGFSQPFLSRIGSDGNKVKTVILILDRSPSMELVTNEGTAGGGKSKRQLVLENVRQTLANMPETKLKVLDTATKKIHDIINPQALQDLRLTAPTDAAANIAENLSTALEYSYQNKQDLGKTEIWLASDMQKSNWQPNHDIWQTINNNAANHDAPRVRVIAMTGKNAKNKAIRINKVRREGNKLHLNLEIARQENDTNEVIPVTFVTGIGETTENINLRENVTKIQHTINLTSNQKEGFGYISLEQDSNSKDNVAYFVFGEKKELNLTLVAQSKDIERQLLRITSIFNHLNLTTLQPSNLHQLNLKNQHLLLWQAPLPNQKNAKKIKAFIEKGGNIYCLPPNKTNEKNAQNNLLDISWGKVETAKSNRYFRINSWNHQNGILKDGFSGTALPLDEVQSIRRRNIEGDAIALANWQDGKIMATRKIHGKGQAFFLATLPDLTWSDLEHKGVFLITIYRMIQQANEQIHTPGMFTTTAEENQLQANETRQRLDNYADNTKQAEEKYLAGVWQLGSRNLAINRPHQEDEPEFIDFEADLDPKLTNISTSSLKDSGEEKPAPYQQDIWYYFLFAALAFLLLEASLTLPKKIQSKKAQPST